MIRSASDRQTLNLHCHRRAAAALGIHPSECVSLGELAGALDSAKPGVSKRITAFLDCDGKLSTLLFEEPGIGEPQHVTDAWANEVQKAREALYNARQAFETQLHA